MSKNKSKISQKNKSKISQKYVKSYDKIVTFGSNGWQSKTNITWHFVWVFYSTNSNLRLGLSQENNLKTINPDPDSSCHGNQNKTEKASPL
jgi:hypothetical protein